MNPRFPLATLWITASIYAGFAVWLGFSPNALLDAFGIDQRTAAMTTEIRAFYGGVEIAIAAAMVLLWWRDDLFAALLIGGLPLAASATGRCIGLLVDGFSAVHLGLAVTEVLGASCCLNACWMTSRAKVDE